MLDIGTIDTDINWSSLVMVCLSWMRDLSIVFNSDDFRRRTVIGSYGLYVFDVVVVDTNKESKSSCSSVHWTNSWTVHGRDDLCFSSDNDNDNDDVGDVILIVECEVGTSELCHSLRSRSIHSVIEFKVGI